MDDDGARLFPKQPVSDTPSGARQTSPSKRTPRTIAVRRAQPGSQVADTAKASGTCELLCQHSSSSQPVPKRTRRSNAELTMTVSELSAIAAAAMIGFR